MLVHLSLWPAVFLDIAAWAAWGVLTGAAGSRMPARWLERETWLTRGRRWERDGRTYARRLRTGRWQRHLPEAGAVFGGGDKRRVGGRSTAALTRYASETRRAEAVHWANLAAAPAFALWNGPAMAGVMVAYAAAANVPCIVSLRANRLRIGRILARRGARPAPPPAQRNTACR